MPIMPKLKACVAFLVFLTALITYCATVAPTTPLWDAGEFISCAYILGVPHPPGAPLYLLWARIFSLLPMAEDIALRVNLLSALMSAVSSALVFLIIVRLLEMWQGTAESLEQRLTQYAGGAIGALAFAFSDSQWFNSVEAELYSGSLLLMALIFWVILKWLEKHNPSEASRYLLLAFYLVGLAIGMHLLTLLALPAIFLLMYFRRPQLSLKSFFHFVPAAAAAVAITYPVIPKKIPEWIESFSILTIVVLLVLLGMGIHLANKARKQAVAVALTALLFVLVGYSTYTTIFIRSLHDPVIDMNNPDTAARFNKYSSREQYGNWSLWPRRAPLWEYQLKQMYVRYFVWQFVGKNAERQELETFSLRGLWGLPFLLGITGMLRHFRKDWRRAAVILLLFLTTSLALVLYLNQENPQPRDRDYVYTASFLAFALWIGVGAAAVLEFARRKLPGSFAPRLALAALSVILFVLVPGRMFAFNYPTHNRTGNFFAYDYSYNLLQSCAPDAILFTNGDNDTYPLWTLQTVYGVRPDIRVVCLSLLNTDWYIQQLKRFEPRVPIRMTDEQIETLQPMHWPQRKKLTLNVPSQVHAEWLEEVKALYPSESFTAKPVMDFEVEPTWLGQYIRIQDILALHILSENKFKRPVYFATTVSPDNMLGLQDYLRMDGLAFRVTPIRKKNGSLDPSRLRALLFDEFQYRNLGNPKVHFDEDSLALLTNYRSAFLRLAYHHQSRGEQGLALEVLDKMSEVMPERVVPLRSASLSLAIGQLYHAAGRPEELKKRLEAISAEPDLGFANKLELAGYWSAWLGEWSRAESLAFSALQDEPGRPESYSFLVGEYQRRSRQQEAIAILERWLSRNPNDPGALQELQRLKEGRTR
jgi:hypothetical protein